jgi:hypothetical protein
MIAARADDGAFGDQLWPEGTEPGQRRPTPPNFLNAGAWYARMKPFIPGCVDVPHIRAA